MQALDGEEGGGTALEGEEVGEKEIELLFFLYCTIQLQLSFGYASWSFRGKTRVFLL